MKKAIIYLAVMLFGLNLNSQVTLKDTVELQMRDGLPNFFLKASTGQPTLVGYIGGSITNVEGWRSQTFNWFKEHFNNNNITEVNAAIGGTDSKYGVFRIEEQLLNKGDFDLIFIEFAVNDLVTNSDEIDNSIEGMIRKIWKKNPHTDICIVHMLREGEMLDNINNGKMPLTSTIHDMVAAYYNIPSVFCGVRVVELLKSGTVVMSGTITDSQHDKNSQGQYVFTQDGVHPTNYGHGIYAQIVEKCFALMETNKQDFAHDLKPSMVDNNYQYANMYPWEVNSNSGLTDATVAGEFDFLDSFINNGSSFLLGENQSSYYEFKFFGDIFGFSLIRGPNTGRSIINFDGTILNHDFFDAYSYNYRESGIFIAVPLDTHIVRISPGVPFTLEEKESKLIDERKAEIQQNPSAYEHNYIIFDKIMISGTLTTDIPNNIQSGEKDNVSIIVQNDNLLIGIPENTAGRNVFIYNIMGELVYSGILESNVNEIPMRTDHGIYMMHISNNNGSDQQIFKIAL